MGFIKSYMRLKRVIVIGILGSWSYCGIRFLEYIGGLDLVLKMSIFYLCEFYFIFYSMKIYIIEKYFFICKGNIGKEIRKWNVINL